VPWVQKEEPYVTFPVFEFGQVIPRMAVDVYTQGMLQGAYHSQP
jgi:hypothetical protein